MHTQTHICTNVTHKHNKTYILMQPQAHMHINSAFHTPMYNTQVQKHQHKHMCSQPHTHSHMLLGNSTTLHETDTLKPSCFQTQEMLCKVPLLGKLPAGWREPWGPSPMLPADPGAFFPELPAESPPRSFVPVCSILSSSHYKRNQTKARGRPVTGCYAHLTGAGG